MFPIRRIRCAAAAALPGPAYDWLGIAVAALMSSRARDRMWPASQIVSRVRGLRP